MAGLKAEEDGLEWPLGDRDSRWPLFAQGAPGDRAKPSAWQVMVLHDLSGPDGRCAGATDDEVFGVLGQWGAASSWVEARKLAVARELIRRRPDERSEGTATESGLPWDWDDRLAREIALELRVSVPAAQKLAWTAWALEARLPEVGRALEDGRLDPGKARMVIEETRVLTEPGQLAAAERLIIDGLPKCKTWMDLLRLVQRAVVTVDPDGARKRREQEEKENARVQFWREAAGTCALMGAGLPADEALKAHAHVDQRAQQYRAAGIKRPIDILRVAAYLDLLNLVPAIDRIARFQAEDAAPAAGEAPQPAGDAPGPAGSPHDREPAKGSAEGDPPGDDRSRRDPSDSGRPDGSRARDAHGSSAHGGLDGDSVGAGSAHEAGSHGGPGGGDRDDRRGREDSPRGGCGCGSHGPGGGGALDPEPGVAAEVNLTLRHLDIPFLTAAGLGQQAGEARSLGILDPGLARRIAEAAARHPDSKFCVTIVDQEGRAVGHGCCKPRKPRKPRKGQRDGPPPPATPGFTLTPNDRAGPAGGYGSWILTLPGRDVEHVVDLHPVPTGECGHQYESARHDPGDLLRHIVSVRDGKCGFPACSRHARESDFEHATPYEKGGRTCGCNCWSCSRSCHQLKQSDGWTVTEARPGYHQWRTPSGRAYTQAPWRYPA